MFNREIRVSMKKPDDTNRQKANNNSAELIDKAGKQVLKLVVLYFALNTISKVIIQNTKK